MCATFSLSPYPPTSLLLSLSFRPRKTFLLIVVTLSDICQPFLANWKPRLSQRAFSLPDNCLKSLNFSTNATAAGSGVAAPVVLVCGVGGDGEGGCVVVCVCVCSETDQWANRSPIVNHCRRASNYWNWLGKWFGYWIMGRKNWSTNGGAQLRLILSRREKNGFGHLFFYQVIDCGHSFAWFESLKGIPFASLAPSSSFFFLLLLLVILCVFLRHDLWNDFWPSPFSLLIESRLSLIQKNNKFELRSSSVQPFSIRFATTQSSIDRSKCGRCAQQQYVAKIVCLCPFALDGSFLGAFGKSICVCVNSFATDKFVYSDRRQSVDRDYCKWRNFFLPGTKDQLRTHTRWMLTMR